MSDLNSKTPAAIEPIVLSTSSLGGQFATMRMSLKAKAEERNVQAAATAMFALTDPNSFLRLAATFDALEPASKVKSLEAALRTAQKANEKLTELNGRLSGNLKSVGSKAGLVNQLQRELVEQQEAFRGILALLEVSPEELEEMTARMEADFATENAAIVSASRSNRIGRSSVAKIQKITGKM